MNGNSHNIKKTVRLSPNKLETRACNCCIKNNLNL